jgi:hypothetical protein
LYEDGIFRVDRHREFICIRSFAGYFDAVGFEFSQIVASRKNIDNKGVNFSLFEHLKAFFDIPGSHSKGISG